MCLKVVLLRGIVFLLFTTVIYSQSPLNLKQLVDSLDSAKQSVSQVSTPKQNKSTQLFKIIRIKSNIKQNRNNTSKFYYWTLKKYEQ